MLVLCLKRSILYYKHSGLISRAARFSCSEEYCFDSILSAFICCSFLRRRIRIRNPEKSVRSKQNLWRKCSIKTHTNNTGKSSRVEELYCLNVSFALFNSATISMFDMRTPLTYGVPIFRWEGILSFLSSSIASVSKCYGRFLISIRTLINETNISPAK